MEQFLQLALSFPTVIFSALLGLSLLYWMFVIVGAVDIDMFGGADGAAEGAAEGATEGGIEGIKEGIAEGLKEGIAEGLKEGLFEGLKEGVAEGMAEGAGDGALEGAKAGMGESTTDAVGHAGLLATIFGALKLRSAPVTVVTSIFLLFNWVLSSVTMHLGAPRLPDSVPEWALGLGVLTVGSVVSLLATSITVRPLAPVFKVHRTVGGDTLVGKELIIMTQTVDRRFGQARPADSKSDLILSVRCADPNSLTKGARALIIDYDKTHNIYHVEPMDVLLPPSLTVDEELDALAEVHQTKEA